MVGLIMHSHDRTAVTTILALDHPVQPGYSVAGREIGLAWHRSRLWVASFRIGSLHGEPLACFRANTGSLGNFSIFSSFLTHQIAI